jgi:hypothetical protein
MTGKIGDMADVQLGRYEMWLLRTLILAELPKVEADLPFAPTPALQEYAVYKLETLNTLDEYLLTCLEAMGEKEVV